MKIKPTWLKDVLRNIRKRIVSWLSIVTIVFIGTSVITGLIFTFTSIEEHINNYTEEYNFRDLDIVCSLGIKEEDVEKIKALDGVYDAEGQIYLDAEMLYGGQNLGLYVESITDRVSLPYALEGELPASIYECALCQEAAEKLGVSIGDEVDLVVTAARFENVLVNNHFKVTGIAAHPDYMALNLEDYCVLSKEAFDTSDSSFDYTNILVDLGPRGTDSVLSKHYTDRTETVKAEAKGIFEEMATQRMADLSKDLDKEYAKAEAEVNKELDKGKAQIDDAQKLFDDEIDKARKELEDGQQKINDAKATVEKELAAAEKKIKDGENEYNTQIADGERQLNEAEERMEKELEQARFELFDGMLQIDQNEKLLQQKEAEYQDGLNELAAADAQLNSGRTQYANGVNQLDNTLTPASLDGAISILTPYAADPEIAGIIARLQGAKSMGAIDRADEVLAVYDEFFDDIGITPAEKAQIDADLGINALRNGLQQLKNAKAMVDNGQREYDAGVEKLQDARRMLDDGWYSLGQAKQKLADGQAQYNAKEPQARKQLADARAEFERKKAEGAAQLEDARKTFTSKKKEALDEIKKYEDELEEGKEEFNTQKEKGEKELAKAWGEYEDARKEAMDKLSEVKAQIDEARDMECKWLAQTREANVDYVLLRSICRTIKHFFSGFTPVISAIIVVVSFFTMIIIIEEQTKLIGTCKAFGMYKSEIRNKYIIFGATAAIVGSIIGLGGAYFIEEMVLQSQISVFVFGKMAHKFNPLPVIVIPVLITLLTCAAVYFSCERFISCSAVGLISGNEPVKKSRTKQSRFRIGSVYTRLVFSNFITDLGREIVSVVIVLLCILLIAIGMSIRLGYGGAINAQIKDVWKYDIRVTESEVITEEEKEKVRDIIKDYEHTYVGYYGGILENSSDKQIMTEIVCLDSLDEIKDFYVIQDKHGKELTLTDDAIIVMQEMKEKDGLEIGSTAALINGELIMKQVNIGENFLQYFGKMVIISNKYYEKLFGTIPEKNTYLIRVADGDPKAVAEQLSTIEGLSEVTLATQLRENNKSLLYLYSVIVMLVVGLSILLSFMILLNLSNILVTHRTRELLTMRVNGFSNGQVIGYLVREIIVTMTLGIGFALLVGIPGCRFMLKMIETDGLMYEEKTYALTWIVAIGVNVIFSFLINGLAFRKIRKIPLTDITKY